MVACKTIKLQALYKRFYKRYYYKLMHFLNIKY